MIKPSDQSKMRLAIYIYVYNNAFIQDPRL